MCSAFFLCVFFFKQKTAYEMRISDWSSDVCSSDLVLVRVEKRRDDVLYINDGAYGSLFDAAHVAWRFPVKLVREKESAARPLNFSFYGPTCDDMDHMAGPFALSADVQEGVYIAGGMTGAVGEANSNRAAKEQGGEERG